MKKYALFLLIALLALSAMPALAADEAPPMPPFRFTMWGTVTAVDTTASTFTADVIILRGGRGAPPATMTLQVGQRTRFMIHSDTGNVPGTFADLAVGQTVMVNGVRTRDASHAQMVLINAPIPPQQFAIGGPITALDAAAHSITVEVVHAMPPALGLQPGDSVVITTNDQTRFCAAAAGQPCTPITFDDLAVGDRLATNGVVLDSVFVARQVTKLPAAP